MQQQIIIFTDELNTELSFRYSPSSGPGGQHVNRVNTKVELRFDLHKSAILTDEQIVLVLDKWSNKMTQEGVLIVVSQSSRSQLKNKEDAISKFYALINQALEPKKIRKPTKVSKAAKEKRLKNKKELSEKKERRKIK